MKVPIVIFKKLPVSGMAIFPFILLKSERLKQDPVIINHEKIHLRQQLELLILPFYLCYVVNYLINLIKYKQHDLAYRNIVFEKEAYRYKSELSYLKGRECYGWVCV